MNKKRIAFHLRNTIDKWCKHIDCSETVDIIKRNVIVTGGALVSLLTGEEPHDYDMYFKTKEACIAVAQYYAKAWNLSDHEKQVSIKDDNGRVTCFIQSSGVADDEEDFEAEYDGPIFEEEEEAPKGKKQEKKKPYRPKHFSTNAISLSDKIQIIIRFYGNVEEIHTNYDFIHCTCSYDYATDMVNLPSEALEAIINMELVYSGSKYPICSVIRARKFLSRGWHINAGQYVKMAFQIKELDLDNMDVLYDQLTGVDSAYFSSFINEISRMKEENGSENLDMTTYMEVINRVFG